MHSYAHSIDNPIKRHNRVLSTYLCLYILYVSLAYPHVNLSSATDTISKNQSIADGQFLTSAGGRFRLGFLSTSNSSRNRYLGVWYNFGPSDPVIVWIANRENPIVGFSGVLKFDGANLVLVGGNNRTFWSTNIDTVTAIVATAKLQDTGNFVLSQRNAGVLWNSFDHITDTFLPGAEISYDFGTKIYNTLTSWKSNVDPSPGNFMIGILSNGFDQGCIFVNGSKPYWRMGPWIGKQFIGVPDMPSGYWDGFSLNRVGNLITYSYPIYNDSADLERLVLDSTGQFISWEWDSVKKEWSKPWQKPEHPCDVYATCGEFAVCNSSSSPICSCMKGFFPSSSEDWAKGNWSGGCVRQTELACIRNPSNDTMARGDGFLKVGSLKLPDFAAWLDSNNETYCRGWCLENCQCLAYAYVGSNCMVWNDSLVDMRVFSSGGLDLNVKMNFSEADHVLGNYSSSHKNSKKTVIIATLVAVVGVIFFSCIILFGIRLVKQRGSRKRRTLTLEDQELTNAFHSSSTETKGLDFLQYDLEKIITATDDFDMKNKLGEGGFGPVYKGVLPGGQEIAVKRLSKSSAQGLREFKNEVLLISKLQHRNLVQLLGYCINAEEKLLIYEFMPNKSLDAFLFGSMKEYLLDWPKRFRIIEGIAQGLLYLHRDSRLRIIHRDLKTSNILLDSELNPKISDFGTARIFGMDQILMTDTIIGTHGYMSPEYAMQGHFSEKSDVYSFGVMLLEILSSARISSFYDEQQSLNLLGYAWKLWKEGDTLQFIDANLRESWPLDNVTKCITVALLCVQELATNRPTMSSVVSMLIGDNPCLPVPMQPAFIGRRDPLGFSSSDYSQQTVSDYGVIIKPSLERVIAEKS